MHQNSLFDTVPVDMLAFERRARLRGHMLIAGIDEAGRGPLAGPVVAAAVILPPELYLEGVNDSKKLSPQKRECLYDVIMNQAISVGIGIGTPELIDQINILQATRYAMCQAVEQLIPAPDYLLIDGITQIAVSRPQKTIIKGDSLSLSIAAASIIAKVTRDRMMTELDSIHPGYGFAAHKGYGCSSHMDAIRRLGPTAVHRFTFGGVKEHVSCLSF
ncbi:MAG: ribonuclease HII [Geobacteraceae bacterium GWC2_48_7]|nr:MAG: ribonuclease HII [Geobacteraceae bacterium GWC2_48_7]